MLYGMHETIKPSKSIDLVHISNPGCFQRTSQHLDGFAVGLEGDGKRVAVFAPESERKTCGIRKPRGRSMNDFGNQGQRLKSSRAKLLQQQQRCEIMKLAFVRYGEDCSQAFEIHIVSSDIVTHRHCQFPNIS